MELGDSIAPDWRTDPSTYVPRDLVNERLRSPGHRLPASECFQLGIALAEAIEFLHQQGFTHRDIKPQNVLFVNGRPKLADFGLVAEIRPPDQPRTYVGTPGYLPPAPELPGTPQADIYALGMMLFVLSTGRNPVFFPEIATTLAGSPAMAHYLKLNAIILKACEPDCKLRYASATELRLALQEAAARLAS